MYDLGKLPPQSKNAAVALAVDVPRVWDLIIDALKHADSVSILNNNI